jgi:hypothetical protein
MDDTRRCDSWALSFYISAENARAAFEKLQRSNPKIHRAIGDSVAAGEVREGDGVICECDSEGHFDLHEYDSVTFDGRFTVVARLV